MKKIFLILFCTVTSVWAAETERDFINKAGSLLKENKYNEAIAVLESGQTKNPDSVEINLTLGLAYIQTEQYLQSENCFLSVLRVDSNSLSAHYSLAMLYEKLRRFFDAIYQWNKVLNITNDKALKEFAQKHIKYLESQLKK